MSEKELFIAGPTQQTLTIFSPDDGNNFALKNYICS